MGSGEEAAVDEEGGRAGYADFLAVGHVFLDVGLVLAGRVALFEFVYVEAKLGRIFFKVRVIKILRGGEKFVVELPEFALLVSAISGFGCRGGAGVIPKGEVTEDDADFVAVGVLNLL